MKTLILLSALAVGSLGFLFGGPAWNDLVVKWGVIGLTSNVFQHMPRTTREAQQLGFVPKLGGDFCFNGNTEFRGTQYWKNSDPTIILLFDKNGYIAGIQNGVAKSAYTPSPWAQNVSFVEYQDLWLLTVYFVKPYQVNQDNSVTDVICSLGRSASDFQKYGTGNRFYIQNGTNPLNQTQLVNIPLSERDLNPNQRDGWNKGKCFATIGENYWYKLSKNMDCHHMYPINVVYNGGQLNAFSFLINAQINSTYVEHSTNGEAGLVMSTIPDCLFTTPGYQKLSAIHVYMASCTLPNQVCQLC